MNYEAYDLGKAAFVAGKKRIPVHDTELAKYLKAVGNNVKAVNMALKDWLEGWDEANLAAPVPESNMNDMRNIIEAVKKAGDDEKVYAIKLKGKRIGTLWQDGGEWHCEHSRTGMSWATDDRQDAIDRVVDHDGSGSQRVVDESEDWHAESSPDEGFVATCPKCGSHDVSGQLHPTISPSTTQLVCNNCGHEEQIDTVPAKQGVVHEEAAEAVVRSPGEIVLHMFKDIMKLRNYATTELNDMQSELNKGILDEQDALVTYRDLVNEINQIVDKYSKTKVR